MIKELAEYIEAQSAGWPTPFVRGTNLSVGFVDLDASEENLAIVDDVGGNSNFYIAGKSEITMHFVLRAENQDTARKNAYRVHSLFHGKAQIVLPEIEVGNGITINTADGDTPIYVGRDAKELTMYNLYIDFDIKKTGT